MNKKPPPRSSRASSAKSPLTLPTLSSAKPAYASVREKMRAHSAKAAAEYEAATPASLAAPVEIRDQLPSAKLPRLERLVYDLAKIHCSKKEIAGVLHMPIARLSDTPGLKAAYDMGVEFGCMSLKRRMHAKAHGGDTHMLIFLAKNRLGYRDKQPDEVSNAIFNVTVREVPLAPVQQIDVSPEQIAQKPQPGWVKV